MPPAIGDLVLPRSDGEETLLFEDILISGRCQPVAIWPPQSTGVVLSTRSSTLLDDFTPEFVLVLVGDTVGYTYSDCIVRIASN